MSPVSPLAAWQQAVDNRVFQHDAAQFEAAQALEACYTAVQAGQRRTPVHGVYLWGPVGRGKTWLMDRFYESLQVPARRQHFHHFMRWVHQRMFQLVGTAQPLQVLAREVAKDVRVLCFDELFVNDIGDAVILGGLLQAMFEEGVVVVSTSNQPPDQLYEGGHNRERFLPAIAAIKRYMDVVAVDGGEDHRLHPGAAQPRYWVVEPGDSGPFPDLFERLAAGSVTSEEPLSLGRRAVPVVKRSERVAWFRYRALCDQPLAASDFIELCDGVDAVLLSDVPPLSASQREAKIARGTEDAAERVVAGDRELPQLSPNDDGVRRFIALVDECYDRRVPLYVQAAMPMETLYTEGYLAFAFRRTLSRLREMQLERFGT